MSVDKDLLELPLEIGAIDPDKYIVFKRNEFFELMGELGLPPYKRIPTPQALQPDCTFPGPTDVAGEDWDCAVIASHITERVGTVELRDAVVIRLGDEFAPPALDTYANSITIALELAQRSHPLFDHLRGVADYFHEMAAKSWSLRRKLPD